MFFTIFLVPPSAISCLVPYKKGRFLEAWLPVPSLVLECCSRPCSWMDPFWAMVRVSLLFNYFCNVFDLFFMCPHYGQRVCVCIFIHTHILFFFYRSLSYHMDPCIYSCPFPLLGAFHHRIAAPQHQAYCF